MKADVFKPRITNRIEVSIDLIIVFIVIDTYNTTTIGLNIFPYVCRVVTYALLYHGVSRDTGRIRDGKMAISLAPSYTLSTKTL